MNDVHPGISRRVFLTRLGGLTLSLGSAPLWFPRAAFARDPYEGGVWLAGDHHIHTKFSPDGQYDIETQVAAAARFGLSWCVITDHGGPNHDKVAIDQAYPELIASRKKHSAMSIFQGMEWNIPAAEHGTVILPPTADEARRIAEFESRFDEKNFKAKATTEAAAIEGVKYLQTLSSKPIFIANHPARRGRNSPHEMRSWADAGPDVFCGFEGSPGHQASTLVGARRGHYEKDRAKDSWPQYPDESYRTWGGYDWYVAKVGGLWDSLLGEGRPWYITTNSDSHRHYTDHTVVDEKTYLTHGHVTAAAQKSDHVVNMDFWPGEYNKTWVHAASADPIAILSALRGGSMFPVHGGLIDRLEFTARSADSAASMGGSLVLEKRGQTVEMRIRLRTGKCSNTTIKQPELHHIDVIAGDILGIAENHDSIANESTKIVARLTQKDAKHEGPWLSFTHRFPNVSKNFYIRLRGTNRDIEQPEIDPPKIDPWSDLWFYSNPIRVRIKT